MKDKEIEPDMIIRLPKSLGRQVIAYLYGCFDQASVQGKSLDDDAVILKAFESAKNTFQLKEDKEE